MPECENGPVRYVRFGTKMLSCAAVVVTEAASSPVTTAAIAGDVMRMVVPSRLQQRVYARLDRLCKYASSIGKWPDSQFLFGDLPQPRQPVRFDDQEGDDERAQDHESQMLDGSRTHAQAEPRRHEAP